MNLKSMEKRVRRGLTAIMAPLLAFGAVSGPAPCVAIDTIYDPMDQISPWQLGGAAAGSTSLTVSTNISSTGFGSINMTTTFSAGQTFVDLYWDSLGAVDLSQNIFRLDFRTSDTNALLLWRLGTQSGPVYETLGAASAADTFTTVSQLSSNFSGATENLSNVNLIQLRFIADNVASLPATIDFFIDNLRIDAYRNIATGQTSTITNIITGSGGFYKTGAGTLTMATLNNFTGALEVQEGVLDLATEGGGAAATASSAKVAAGATLLISQNNQISDGATVTLSGGTILRGSSITEVLGNLSLTAASFIDFGAGGTGTLQFGYYTPSALLTVQNFLPGNRLVFASNLTSEQLSTNFDFDGEFTTNWDGDTFTITAIPEPPVLLAATAMLLLLAAPSGDLRCRWVTGFHDFFHTNNQEKP